jgi:hypothetical protein
MDSINDPDLRWWLLLGLGWVCRILIHESHGHPAPHANPVQFSTT